MEYIHLWLGKSHLLNGRTHFYVMILNKAPPVGYRYKQAGIIERTRKRLGRLNPVFMKNGHTHFSLSVSSACIQATFHSTPHKTLALQLEG